jgi:iron-sulfur cluster assembly protein
MGGTATPENIRSKREMVQLTEKAIGKVKEIMSSQDPAPAGLRIAVVGGGCSGFSYSMAFENQPNMLDKTYSYDGLKVFVDQASLLYLDGAEVDYVESLEGAGFKFSNPHVKSTCGCGSSFQV